MRIIRVSCVSIIALALLFGQAAYGQDEAKPARQQCGHCNNTGYVTCPECNGKWQKSTQIVDCQQCKTSGEVRCFDCRGKGVLKCETCNGKGSVRIAYRQYRRDGRHYDLQYRDEPCPACRQWSRNEKIPAGYKPCPRCNSTGHLVCPRCKGQGHYEEITRCPHCEKGRVLCPVCGGAAAPEPVPVAIGPQPLSLKELTELQRIVRERLPPKQAKRVNTILTQYARLRNILVRVVEGKADKAAAAESLAGSDDQMHK